MTAKCPHCGTKSYKSHLILQLAESVLFDDPDNAKSVTLYVLRELAYEDIAAEKRIYELLEKANISLDDVFCPTQSTGQK